MRTVAMLNKKGGVGKTSTTHHLAGVLASRGYRVLLVDADPQANLTQGLLGPDVTWGLHPSRTLAALFDDRWGTASGDLAVGTPVAGVAIVPGSEAMEDMNVTRPAETGPLQFVIRDALSDVAGRFDFALIDCPPNVNLCSWSALAAADAVVVPLQCEDYGAQGVVAVRRSIRRAQATVNPSLALLGYLVTMFDRRVGVHVAYEADLRRIYGDLVFAQVVPLAKDFKEAVAARKPVTQFKPKSAAARAMAAIGDEFLDRLGRSADARGVA